MFSLAIILNNVGSETTQLVDVYLLLVNMFLIL